MRHHHYDFMKKNSSNEDSYECCYVLPYQKIFCLNDKMKDVLNEMLDLTSYNLEEFDELDVECFQMRENEKKQDKEFLIVEKEEIRKITHIPQIKEEYSEKNDHSDIRDISLLKKRERDVIKKANKKNKYENLYYLKKNKKYQNGDIDMNGNTAECLKRLKKCYGCCYCFNKKKSKNKTDKDIISKEEGLKLENENKEEEIMKIPSFENPLEYLDSVTITKQNFNVYHEHFLSYFSKVISLFNQKFRQIDETKSNKKKFRNINNNEKNVLRAKKILTNFEKGEIGRKINTFNTNQIQEVMEKFPSCRTENNEFCLNLLETPNSILIKMKEIVDKIYSDNLGNPFHQNYIKENEVLILLLILKTKNRLAEQSGPKPIISSADPRYFNKITNNFNKSRNALLSDKDDDISISISSSSESSMRPSISDLEEKFNKNSSSFGFATSENFTSRNMISKTFIEDDYVNSLSDEEDSSSERDDI